MKRSLLAASCLLSACTSFTPPGPPTPRAATEVNASMGHTWDAVIDLFGDRNIPIRTIERASGIIATEQLSVGAEGRAWADCGSDKGEMVPPNYAIYNVLVRGDSASSSVKVTVRWTRKTGPAQSYECSTTHVWERGLEDTARQHAEAQARMALSAAPPPPPRPAAQPVADSAETRTDIVGAAPARPVAPSSERSRRPGTELLRDPTFAAAITDLQGFSAVRGFGETGRDTLTVQLTDAGLAAPALTHYLRRLYYAYRGLTGLSDDTILLLLHGGRLAGTFNQMGLNKRNWR